MGFETWTDPVVTWTGAVGVFAYVAYIHQRRMRSSLEGKILLLLYTLGSLFLIRGFSWRWEHELLTTLTFVPATFLPLVTTLFVETMIRRHARPALKVFVGLGVAVFVPWNLLASDSRATFFLAFRIYALVTFAWLGLMLLARRRAALAPMENQLIDGFTLALAIGLFLIMTDVQIRPAWLPFRLGSIGGLIFVYVCVRLTNRAESPLATAREIGLVGLMAGGLTGALSLLMPEATPELRLAVFVVVLAFLLLYTVLARLRALRTADRRASFQRWLQHAPTTSLDDLVAALHRLPWADHHVVLRRDEIRGCDPTVMVRVFDDDHPVWTAGGLERRSHEADDPVPYEQLTELLGQYQMTHVTVLGTAPPTFLLINAPQFAGSLDPSPELGLLYKYAGMLRERHRTDTPAERTARANRTVTPA